MSSNGTEKQEDVFAGLVGKDAEVPRSTATNSVQGGLPRKDKNSEELLLA